MNQVPSLEELAGDWQDAKDLAQCPSLHNFHGTLLTNRDLTSISWLASLPYSQSHHSGALSVNDVVVKASELKWSAYEALRKASVSGVEIQSSVRMAFEENSIFFKLVFKNSTSERQSLKLKQDLIASISKFQNSSDWDWLYRQPGYAEDPGDRSITFKAFQETEVSRSELKSLPESMDQFKAEVIADKNILFIDDLQTQACSAFCFPAERNIKLMALNNQGYAEYEVELQPNATEELSYVMTFGDHRDEVLNACEQKCNSFEVEFESVKEKWQDRFNKAFTEKNDHFSGHLPVLITDDKKLQRVYYMGVITLLMLHRTNMPVLPRSYLTGSPRLGATVMFYWDTSMWSTVFALLDPVIMKQSLKNWLQLDIDKYFGQDMLSGRGLGNMYSASRMNIFKMILTYVNVSGDELFLDEDVNGESVLQHLENLATRWKSQVQEGSPLADYGEAINLLECVPTYIHRVPSFNAANVWMMRKLADVLDKKGHSGKSIELRAEADNLSNAVFELYKQGEGVWHSLHRDGEKVEMRHCYDFITVGKFLTDELSDAQKTEMVGFVEGELLTKSWMRAQSLSDVAADHSDRADHGPMGAYDAWPAQTVDVMALFGQWQKALSFLHDCEGATREGNFSQARELFGANKNNYQADVRIADRDLINRECSGGVAFANTVIESMFGFNPLATKEDTPIVDAKNSRHFIGELNNFNYQGKSCSIVSSANGLEMK